MRPSYVIIGGNDGAIMGFHYRDNTYAKDVFDTYFYEKTYLGDVIGIYDENGTRLAWYMYDAWGNVVHSNCATGYTDLMNANPFRYRGYYFDTDTGLYYLNSRYYNPILGRFINADKYASTGTGFIGYNMYAYCNNNPIDFYDPMGLCAIAWSLGYHGPCPGQGMPGCMDLKYQTDSDISNIIGPIDRNSPPDHPDYKPPKKGGGKKVRNPNGYGWGWPADDGGVWVPNPGMHGGEGWDIQYPDGSHGHAYPGGGVRRHSESIPSIGAATGMIIVGSIFTAALIIDNLTGIGAVDDPLIVCSVALVGSGIGAYNETYVCPICGG